MAPLGVWKEVDAKIPRPLLDGIDGRDLSRDADDPDESKRP